MYKPIAFSIGLTLLAVAAVSNLRSTPPAPSTTTSTAAKPSSAYEEDGFVVHEWGTFTTFSGSDGVLLEFRPLAAQHNDLPNYVDDRGSHSKNISRLLSKNRLRGRVRMETPVTYFYTDRVRTVDVRVDFPQGLLTEFYPPVSEMQPPIDEANIFGKGESIGQSSLSWNNVDLIPLKEFVPEISDSELQSRLTDRIVQSLLPHAPNEQHYATARETDSALVHMRGTPGGTSSFEKFLFYRGVGKFELPITSAFVEDSLVVKNAGDLPVHSAILIRVEGEQISAAKIDRIDAQAQTHFDGLQEVSQAQLAEMVQRSLMAEGLYEKEAASMVATWQQSWFTENGSRVLYIVPEPTTSALLPLQVTPQPDKMLRVLVGRMEIMSPSAEQEISRAVAQSASARALHSAAIAAGQTDQPYSIPDKIRNFGRLAEPALARVSKIAKEEVVRNEAALLIAQYQSQ